MAENSQTDFDVFELLHKIDLSSLVDRKSRTDSQHIARSKYMDQRDVIKYLIEQRNKLLGKLKCLIENVDMESIDTSMIPGFNTVLAGNILESATSMDNDARKLAKEANINAEICGNARVSFLKPKDYLADSVD